MMTQSSPFIQQLLILRMCLLKVFAFVICIFLGLVNFSGPIYTFVAAPLRALLPEGGGMIATEVMSPLLAPLKLTFIVAVFFSLPYIFYQLWKFIAPGLYQHEKRYIFPLMVVSFFLFLLGVGFAYTVILPLLFKFLVHAPPEGVAVMTDINQYLNFVLVLLFSFGIAFEVPIAIVLFVRSGLCSYDQLRRRRPYIVLACFVLGMLLTPPDVFSQTLLAFPMWFLFEIGLFFVKPTFHRKKQVVRH